MTNVDTMYEAESARLWEDLNAPDPCQGRILEAEQSCLAAIRHLTKARDLIDDAVLEIEGLPDETRIASVSEAVDSLISELNKILD